MNSSNLDKLRSREAEARRPEERGERPGSRFLRSRRWAALFRAPSRSDVRRDGQVQELSTGAEHAIGIKVARAEEWRPGVIGNPIRSLVGSRVGRQDGLLRRTAREQVDEDFIPSGHAWRGERERGEI